MYSLNVPVPAAVARLATDLARDLPVARPRGRGDHTLVCKRLGEGERYHRLEARAREALSGADPFDARVTGVDQFREATTGTAPVVYLAVESPGLERLHDHLCGIFDPVEGIEGPDYVPHVTVARGGSPERAAALCERSIDPVEWTVTELTVRDAKRGQPAGSIRLPV